MEGTPNGMKKCVVCGENIAKSAKICPHCGAKNKKPFYKKAWFWILIALVFIVLVLNIATGKTDLDTVSEALSISEEDFKTECVEVDDCEEYFRYAADNIGTYIKLEGEVVQLFTDGETIIISNIVGTTDYQIVVSDYRVNGDSLLVGDEVTLYGVTDGVIEMQNTNGATYNLPKVLGIYIDR